MQKQSTFNEPRRSTQVELPSQGRLYGDLSLDGMVEISPVSTKGEKILADARNIAEVQKEYFERYLTLPPGLTHMDLLTGDRLFLFFMIRAASYGAFYDFQFRCDVCGKMTHTSVNLEELPVKHIPEGLEEPFSYTFPVCGDEITFHLFRGYDEAALQQWLKLQQQRQQAMNKGRREQNKEESAPNTKVFELSRIIKTVNGAPFSSSNEAQRYVEGLIAEDSSDLQAAIEDVEPGLELKVYLECENSVCRAENEVNLSIERDFFRSSRRRRTQNTGPAV